MASYLSCYWGRGTFQPSRCAKLGLCSAGVAGKRGLKEGGGLRGLNPFVVNQWCEFLLDAQAGAWPHDGVMDIAKSKQARRPFQAKHMQIQTFADLSSKQNKEPHASRSLRFKYPPS